MKALSLTEPWATLVAHGMKRSFGRRGLVRRRQCLPQQIDDLPVKAALLFLSFGRNSVVYFLGETNRYPDLFAHDTIIHHIDTTPKWCHDSVMKNGKAMQGHRRLVVAVGEVKVTKRAPEGGWKVGCLCGWDGGVMPNTGAARAAYREHLRAVIEAPRKCKRCGQEKTAVEMADRYSRHICRACYSDAGNQWQAEHPAETARHRRNHHLLMKFGITLAEAETLLERQDGKCAICQNEITDSRNYAPHVDHDHVTGKVRGILCFLCNSGLGSFRDDPNRLRAAIAYLEERQ